MSPLVLLHILVVIENRRYLGVMVCCNNIFLYNGSQLRRWSNEPSSGLNTSRYSYFNKIIYLCKNKCGLRMASWTTMWYGICDRSDPRAVKTPFISFLSILEIKYHNLSGSYSSCLFRHRRFLIIEVHILRRAHSLCTATARRVAASTPNYCSVTASYSSSLFSYCVV